MSSCELSHFGSLSKGDTCRSNRSRGSASRALVAEPTLSPLFAALFPAGVIAAELREPGQASCLKPEELRSIERAVPKRIGEFAAGRQCARRALAEMGFVDALIPVAADRQPVWPPGVVGSITHTAGLCAAVVASETRMAAVGVDTELASAVKPDLWETICVAEESAWIGALAPPERAAAVAMLFSAKEAFYKCQFPLVGERLNFDDLCVSALAWGRGYGAFSMRPQRPLALSAHIDGLESLQGFYRFHEEFVSAGVCIPKPRRVPSRSP
jgi:4'-phosphopantetheinyl transferase EntD